MPTNRIPINRSRWNYQPGNDDERPYSLEHWQRHRDKIMKHEAVFGCRPPEFWVYELNEEMPHDNQPTMLYERGNALTEEEIEYLLTDWRCYYDQMQEPNFSYCIGAKDGDTFATWVEGEEARRLHIEFWGIPSSLIAKWDSKRRKT
jgi:hypothetical protein